MSSIQWTGRTSNIYHLFNEDNSHGGHFCRKISEGCLHCYSESMNNSKYFKFASGLKFAGKIPSNMALDEKELKSWLSPKAETIFVNSMTDSFLEEIPDEWLDRMFDTMLRSPHKTFQILTKRADRMAEYVTALVRKARSRVSDGNIPSHIWLGVTTENQEMFNKRIPHLLKTPATIRFLSCEPLLEEINIWQALPIKDYVGIPTQEKVLFPGVNWVIVGGESGSGSRICRQEWIRSLVFQCQSANTPVFVKQWGANCVGDDGQKLKWRDRKGGNPEEWPEVMPRQFPSCWKGKSDAAV